ncbi:MAG TPA: Imm1 family immunity protein [Polyangiaceae bacterium]|jgi:hypothetical protein|nr:Imm1 family immunity protein [Polyangiaceae bacterium]
MSLRSINRDFEPLRVEAPSTEDVLAAVKELDGKEHTLVTLEVNDNHHMGVGGGAGIYVVYLTNDNLRFKNLVMPGKTGPKLMVTCGGQEGDFDPKQCVALRAALKAAETFALTGQPDPELDWEDA